MVHLINKLAFDTSHPEVQGLVIGLLLNTAHCMLANIWLVRNNSHSVDVFNHAALSLTSPTSIAWNYTVVLKLLS